MPQTACDTSLRLFAKVPLKRRKRVYALGADAVRSFFLVSASRARVFVPPVRRAAFACAFCHGNGPQLVGRRGQAAAPGAHATSPAAPPERARVRGLAVARCDCEKDKAFTPVLSCLARGRCSTCTALSASTGVGVAAPLSTTARSVMRPSLFLLSEYHHVPVLLLKQHPALLLHVCINGIWGRAASSLMSHADIIYLVLFGCCKRSLRSDLRAFHQLTNCVFRVRRCDTKSLLVRTLNENLITWMRLQVGRSALRTRISNSQGLCIDSNQN
eukprot:6178576-Pleurochrysis_carterae.AAC.4